MASTAMFAQTHWQPYNADLSQNGKLNIQCVLTIDDVEVYNGEGMHDEGGEFLEIGAFDENGICRGAKKPVWRAKSNQWQYSLQLFGEAGFTYTFKVYDHATEQELPLLDAMQEVITHTGGNSSMGSPGNPKHINFTWAAVEGYTLEIDPYVDERDNYYLIASPVGEISAEAVEGLMTPSYDFYSFEQNPEDGKEWINHRDDAEFMLQPGVGYLYANNTGTDLIFNREGFSAGPIEAMLQYVTDNPDFPEQSWNLLGNPFGVDAIIGDKPFYRMIDGVLVGQGAGTPIPAMEGFFVNAEEEGEMITIDIAPDQGDKAPSLALNLSNNGKVIDRAILSFGQGQQLPKFQLFKSTKMYIPVEGKDYAIVNSAKQGEMPVSFKAESNGTYTLSFNTEAMGMNYLHLIDNRTGDDIDLLATPSYSFDARTTDNASRFKLVFMANDETNSDSFAFMSDGKLIVSGQGTLQVFDVLGHQLFSQELSASHAPLSILRTPGVYVLQLTNGNDMKTQKIVVE